LSQEGFPDSDYTPFTKRKNISLRRVKLKKGIRRVGIVAGDQPPAEGTDSGRSMARQIDCGMLRDDQIFLREGLALTMLEFRERQFLSFAYPRRRPRFGKHSTDGWSYRPDWWADSPPSSEGLLARWDIKFGKALY
jgi:hypothetical protein